MGQEVIQETSILGKPVQHSPYKTTTVIVTYVHPHQEIIAASLTTGVGVEEPNGGSDECSEHAVVEDSGGIDADQVEECCTQEVEEDGGEGDASIDPSPLAFRQVADGLDTAVAHLKTR